MRTCGILWSMTEDNVRQIVKEETKHLATAESVANLATRVDSIDRRLGSVEGHVDAIGQRVDSMDKKIDTLTTMVDRFTKGMETEKDERISGDHLLERRIEHLEQQQPAT